MKFFIYDAGDQEAEWFDNEATFKAALDDFDFVGKFADEGWSQEADQCFAGKVPDDFQVDEDNSLSDELEPFTTHEAVEVNRQDRPDDINEEGYSPSQDIYWLEHWTYHCGYAFAEKVKP